MTQNSPVVLALFVMRFDVSKCTMDASNWGIVNVCCDDTACNPDMRYTVYRIRYVIYHMCYTLQPIPYVRYRMRDTVYTNCIFENGNHICDRKPGYTGDGEKKCYNVNECANGTHECDVNAKYFGSRGRSIRF